MSDLDVRAARVVEQLEDGTWGKPIAAVDVVMQEAAVVIRELQAELAALRTAAQQGD